MQMDKFNCQQAATEWYREAYQTGRLSRQNKPVVMGSWLDPGV